MFGLLLIAAGPVLGQTRVPRDQTVHRSMVAGQELRVFTYASFHRDCRPSPPPVIKLQTPPAHGTVSFRPGSSTVSVLREDSSDCAGKTYDGVAVWYVPAPGFRGIDTFDYQVINETSLSHDTAVVDVR